MGKVEQIATLVALELMLVRRTDACGTVAGISRAFRCSVVTTATGVTRRGLMDH
jgi:hypothetical protein